MKYVVILCPAARCVPLSSVPELLKVISSQFAS